MAALAAALNGQTTCVDELFGKKIKVSALSKFRRLLRVSLELA